MALTPIYNWPYLTYSDAPDLAAATSGLANSVETTLNTLFTPKVHRQMNRTDVYNITGGQWNHIGSWNTGASFNVGNTTYASGNITVFTPGMYKWELTVFFPATSGQHSRGLKVQIAPDTDPDYDQGQTWWTYPSGSTGALNLTASGSFPLTPTSSGISLVAAMYASFDIAGVVPRAFSVKLDTRS